MIWNARFHPDFKREFRELDEDVQDHIFACVNCLEQFGPEFGRPRVDTLNGSKHANMKELRFKVKIGVWRVAFAFDPDRSAILLVAGDKEGEKEVRFYKTLIAIADQRFDQWLSHAKRKKP